MGLVSGPGTNQRGQSRRQRRRHRPSPLLLGLVGLGFLIHGAAGVTVFSPGAEVAADLSPASLTLETEFAGNDADRLDLHQQISYTARADVRSDKPVAVLRFARHLELPAVPSRPAIALIIDDVGLNTERTMAAIDLPLPITLSFLPYGDNVQGLVDEARFVGHEIFLHLPMEPMGGDNPGPDALVAGLSSADLSQRTEAALDRFEGYTGVNNHMGSRLTQDAALMAEVMSHLSARDVAFVDSITSQRSVAHAVARSMGVASAQRDVFIDHEIDAEQIQVQLGETVRIARMRGTAIAIAHPHADSIEALEEWLVDLERQGIDVVSVSEIIRRRNRGGEQFAAR